MKKQKGVSEVKVEPVIYVGPSKPYIPQYKVFNNGLPKMIEEKIKEKPLLKQLFVPVKDLSKARKGILVKGSTLNIAFNQIKEV